MYYIWVMKKNWTGDKGSAFRILGASNHTEGEREEHDYYATDPIAAKLLLEVEEFENVLEPSCGEGHLSKEFLRAGLEVTSRDIVDRGFGEVSDFLCITNQEWNGDIITNPPYRYAKEFVEKALAIVPEGRKVAMFLKLTFMEGKGRKQMFLNTPPPIGFMFQVVELSVLKMEKTILKTRRLLMVGLCLSKDLKVIQL